MSILINHRLCSVVTLCYIVISKINNCFATTTATSTSTAKPNGILYDYSQRIGEGGRPCDTEQIEYRLTKLEVQVGEKSSHLISELREVNRRLQALEFQSGDVETSFEDFRSELKRLTTFNTPVHFQQVPDYIGNDKLEVRVDNLVKGIQLVVAALRGLNSDSTWIKKNISALVNSTNLLLDQYEHLATKQFLSNSLIEVKHHQIHPQIPDGVFSVPSSTSKSRTPRNCKEILEKGNNVSGIYHIQPENSHKAFMVLCDMDTKDGGWTYIHNRYVGSQDFYLNWHDYKIGFGNLGGEFWLGLENIHQLTGHEINELLVELVDGNGDEVFAYYAAFSIGSEAESYSLKVLGGYKGDAGDSLKYHAGSRFSTKDLDQDSWVEGNCAKAHTGAWWYRGCDTSNLNGKYLNGELPENYLYQGMYWGEFRGAQYSLAEARMMIRPRGADSPPVFPRGLTGNRRS